MLIPRRFPHMLPGELGTLLHSQGEDAATVQAWEEAIARVAGTSQAVCLNSGRQGMTLILRHLGVGPGTEVVVPGYTLGALIPLIEGLGAKAVPADIDARTFNVTLETVAPLLSERTRAIVVLHAFGAPAPVDAIVALADQHGISVVEDCAHSLGATLHGQATGGFGYAGFYSFEITKPVNTYGGGMVVTRDPSLVAFIRKETEHLPPDYAGLAGKVKAAKTERTLMRSGLAWPLLYLLAHPLTRGALSALYRSRQHVPTGAAAYTSAQARLGMRKLESLEDRIAHRNLLARRYRELLDPAVVMQAVPDDAVSTWYFLVARVPVDIQTFRLRLLARGIDCAIGEEVADDVAATMPGNTCPESASLAHCAVALPMYDSLTEGTVARVAAVVNAAIRRH